MNEFSCIDDILLSYFEFVARVAYFGTGAAVDWTSYEVKQCRNGQQVWQGTVLVTSVSEGVKSQWVGDSSYNGVRAGDSRAGDWQANDVIIKKTDACTGYVSMRSSQHDMIIPYLYTFVVIISAAEQYTALANH